MFGLHPGRMITPRGTPDLCEAIKKTLERRGDAGTGWSKAWKVNAWARLERSEVDVDVFCELFEAEARAAGYELSARRVLDALNGDLKVAHLSNVLGNPYVRNR